MRTTFLLTLALAIGTLTFGQSRDAKLIDSKIKSASELRNVIVENPSTNSINYVTESTPTRSNSQLEIGKIEVGTSANIYGLLVADQRCVYFDKATGNLLVTHRGGGPNASGKDGNAIMGTISNDEGATWTQNLLYQSGTAAGAPGNARYPSGVIYNPNNSSNLDDAYAVTVGPMAVGGGWAKTFAVSQTLNAGNNAVTLLDRIVNQDYLYRSGMVATEDGKIHIATGYAVGHDAHQYPTLGLLLMTGTWNATTNSFDWEEKEIDQKPFVYSAEPGKWYGTSEHKVAFTRDGKIGYRYTMGQDVRGITDDETTYYGATAPIIWKTEDYGATWTLLDYKDFGSLKAFNNLRHLSNLPDRVVPIFEDSYSDESDNYWGMQHDCAVDGDGNFHFFSFASSRYSTHKDSLGYGWALNYHHLYQITYNRALNAWGARHIDSIDTESVGPKESPFISDPDNVGWDHRLQASVSDDGRVVLLTYTDTDLEFFPQTGKEVKRVLNPDLLVWACNIDTERVTDTMNLTYMQDVGFGEMHFKFVSPYTQVKDGKYYMHPIYVDINKSGKKADEPQFIYYLKDAHISAEDFTTHSPMFLSTNKQVYVNQVSDCYPNPAVNSTQIDVNLKVNANVTVSVRNMTGQTVSTMNFGSKSVGTHTLDINTSNLAKGVYVVTVNAGKEQHSKKLVVK